MSAPATSTSVAATRRRRLIDLFTVGTGALVCLALTGWLGLDLHQPISFNGDHLLTLGNARSFVDGNGFRWNDSMGFPGERDSLMHPTFYLSQKSIMWLTARTTGNPATVVSVFYGVGIVLLYAACYWSLRRLAIRRALAWVGGVVFVVTPYFAARSAGHDMLAVYYSVPLGAVLALMVGHAGDAASTSIRRASTDRVSWLIVLAVGASGLYYAFFTGLFVAFAGVVASIRRRSSVPVARAAMLGAGLVVVLLVTGPGPGLIDIVSGDVQLPRRLASEQQEHGLSIANPARMFSRVPFTDAWWTGGASGSGLGEWPGFLLMLTIVLSPAIAVGSMVAVWRRGHSAPAADRLALVALSAGCIVFGVLFAVRGGLGFYFNELVSPAIRAQNRIVPFLSFFALVIVLTSVELAAASRRRWVRRVAPVLLTGALVVSVPPGIVGFLATRQAAFLANEYEQADRRSIEAVLDRIHDVGARRVLELPIVFWPEAPLVRGFEPYRLELAHILDRPGSDVRWSYGLSNRQPMFGHLLSVVDAQRDRGLAAAAAGMGFDGILIEKAAFDAAGLAAWTTVIDAEVPAQCRVFDDERRILFFLGTLDGVTCAPAPLDSAFSVMRYVTAGGRYGRSRLYGGWSGAEERYTWNDGVRATMGVPIPPAAFETGHVAIALDFMVYRPDPAKPKTIAFVVRGRERHRIEVARGEAPPTSAVLTVGADDFEDDGTVFVTIFTPDSESPSAYGADDPRRLGIALYEFTARAVR